MSNWKEKYHRFLEWQKKPYQVKPMSAEEHECATCQTHYMGNYCPRCGQSARIGRYSFKKALMLFLDVWGLGNRSMFRSLRDLILRPGYMIRDYISGMQMAYFPPFKMLFLLTALSVIVSHGLNIHGISAEEMQREALETIEEQGWNGDPETTTSILSTTMDIQNRFPNAMTLTMTFLMTLFYYFFFRKPKAYHTLRFSEFLIVMIYTANMLTIYETVLTFFCVKPILITATAILSIIPLKQLSGFSWLRTALCMIAGYLMMLLVVFVITIIITIIVIATGTATGMIK